MQNWISAILLDLDGTLIDSNDAHARAWAEALARHDHPVPFHRIRPLIGEGGDHLLPELTGIPDRSPLGRAIARDRKRIYLEEHFPGVQPFPGARDLIERLHADGYRLCVATSSKEDEMRPALERLGIGDLIEAHASKSDADRSKPAPDLVRASLDHLGVDAPAALMLGDTPYDIEAAARAGVRTVAFRCGGFPDASLGGALAIFDGPRDLLRRYDHSPFSRRSQRGAA